MKTTEKLVIMKTNFKTWNEFLSNCKDAWETEGMNCCNEVKKAHGYLIACDKTGTNSKIEVAAKAYELMIFGCNFKICEAHSGTSKSEITKAKKLFLKYWESGQIYGRVTDRVSMEFSDINSEIKVTFMNEFGEKILEPIIFN